MPRLRNFFHGIPVVTTTVTRDASVPVQNSQAAVQRDASVPVQSSQAEVNRDANVPVENSGFVQRDANVPVENAGTDPFHLGMGWNVYQRLDQRLNMIWNVQQLDQFEKLEVRLPMRWTVFAQLFGASLRMTWDVIPNLPALFTGTGPWAPTSGTNPDIQQPTATITKKP